jgi:hypothetical protein
VGFFVEGFTVMLLPAKDGSIELGEMVDVVPCGFFVEGFPVM